MSWIIGALLAVTSLFFVVAAVEPRPTKMLPTPTVVVTSPLPNDFSEIGTLSFYPNNAGPVPYLFYRTAGGVIVAKALMFASSSPNSLSFWSGARISVVGRTENEHVVVSTAQYVSGP